MRKPLMPRIFLFAAAYIGVFIIIVFIQFGRKNVFIHTIGNLVVQGQYKRSARTADTYALDGGISVFFGGMEFDFGRNDKKSFTLDVSSSETKPARPRSLRFVDNGILLRLEEGPDISILMQYSGGVLELVVEADFPQVFSDESAETESDDVSAGGEHPLGLHIPYKPLMTSTMTENASSFILTADGVHYAFTRNAGQKRIIFLEPGNRSVTYRAIPERKLVNPNDFILASAQDTYGYDTAVALWQDKSYAAWNKAAGSPETIAAFSMDGERTNAYMSEALKRGTYRAAASALAAVYVPSADSWEASVYGGKLDTAFRYLSAFERERYTRLARYLNEKSADFLKDFHVVEYLGERGYSNLLDDAVEILRNFDPAVMTLEQSAGFLEGHFDWEQIRPETDNPFTRFMDQAVFVINDGLRKNPFTGMVLVFAGNRADIELNLRLGTSLIRFDDETRRNVGRSLILSALSLADDTGSTPRTIVQADNGDFGETNEGRLLSARIYRIFGSSDYYAAASAINVPAAAARSGLWAWTAAQSIQATETPTILDIEVNFPAGETHYLMIRGIRPFARLQFYGYDHPMDAQFERNDSSGWLYVPQEQALLVKLKHRSVTEHIRLLQTSAPPPVVREVPVETSE